MVEYSLTYKPLKTISISLTPNFTSSMDNLQYVTTIEGNGENKYIMSKLESKQISLAARINVGITPDLSLQYYGQPFLFSGKYSHFKEITDPLAKNYADRFHEFSCDEIAYDDQSATYSVSKGGNSKNSYSFDNPDFHFLQYRSNLVLRWEYKPGSTLFLVWAQGRTASDSEGRFLFNDYSNELLKTRPQNDFLIKLSYALIF